MTRENMCNDYISDDRANTLKLYYTDPMYENSKVFSSYPIFYITSFFLCVKSRVYAHPSSGKKCNECSRTRIKTAS